MDGTKPDKAKVAKPKYNLWQSSGYMIALAWKRRKSVLWYGLCVAALAVLTSLLGLFVTPVILGAIENAVPLGHLVLTIVWFALGMMVVSAASEYFNTNKLFGRIEIRGHLVSLIHVKFMTTSYPNVENQDVQKQLEKARNSVNSNGEATEAIWNTLTDILKNLAGFVIYLLLLTKVNPWMMGVVVVTTVVGFFITKHINGWGYRHRDEEAEHGHRMYYVTNKAADYTIAKDIRIFGMREWLEDVYQSALRLYQAFATRGEKVYIWGNVVDVVLAFLRNGIAYIYLIGLVLRQGISASEFLLYFSAIGGFTTWMTGVLGGFATLHKQCLDISGVRELLDYPECFAFEEGQPVVPDLSKPCQIELRNVSFRYPKADADTLSHVNLTIQAGEKLAVVGLNGAGKTTLVKLICGFYDPTEGEVLLNGTNIQTYNRRDYYTLFSAVFQDFSLLADSVAGNIAQAAEVDMQRVISCAEKAGLATKIESLPGKYDAKLGKEVYEDGTVLSGGETQRLMLARALYKNAPMMVLDEPTAALDPIAESDMYNRYHELTGGRTSVYISHRLASTRFCDRIVLIDGQGIAEVGTHEALVSAGGKYAELFEIQSRYYREGGELHGQEASAV